MPDLSARLRQHVEHLAGEVGERNSVHYQNLERARHYIEDVFARQGYSFQHDVYQVGKQTHRNVIVEHKGRSAGKTLVVGAHYDTAPGTPGADDNASGVALLLELARLIRSIGSVLTLRFVAFTLEEPPYFRSHLMGSRVHAHRCRQRDDRIAGMISLEMVGYYSDRPGSQHYPLPLMSWVYPNAGNFIAVAGNFRSRHLVRSLARLLAKQIRMPVESTALPFVPGTGLSDNWSFWKEGYPALMITDTAFFRNPHYHGLSDLPDTLDYDQMAALTSGLAGALAVLRFT